MRKIAISMGQEFLKERDETRDFIDVKLVSFLKTCFECDIYLINNFLNSKSKKNQKKNFYNFLQRHKVDTIILSGGQNFGENTLRDKIETQLIEYAIKKKIKLIGICRGMQVINIFFKGTIKKIKNHVRIENIITSNNKNIKKKIKCYHGNGIKVLGKDLKKTFQATDGEIEAFIHKDNKIIGIMWHPERSKSFQQSDINLFKKFLNK